MKGLKGWIEVFRTGKHVDAKGKTFAATKDTLDRIVASYKPEFHEAPVVVGHPKDNSPAYGWVAGLKREGESLYANFRDVASEFSDAVERGLFKKRSISLYADGTLRHVGFLGATPPAVKGLANIEFSNEKTEEMTVIEFSEDALRDTMRYRLELIGEIFGRFRDYIIEKDGLEVADRLISDWSIDAIKREFPAPQISNYNETNGDIMTTEEKAAFDKLTQDFSESQKEVARLKKEKEDRDLEIAQKEETSFCEKLVADGKISPAEKDAYVPILVARRADKQQNIDFAEGKTSEYDLLKKALSERKKTYDFSEQATSESAEGKKQTEPEAVTEIRRAMSTQQ